MAGRGKPFEPGNKGKPKGAKDKVPRSVKQRVMDAWDHLEKKKKSLPKVAEKDPQWFYQTFGRAMLPKAVEHTGEGGGPIKHEHGLTPEASELLKELVG